MRLAHVHVRMYDMLLLDGSNQCMCMYHSISLCVDVFHLHFRQPIYASVYVRHEENISETHTASYSPESVIRV